ncbi:MAG: hypothetical protein Q8R37_05340 [Nanoarchaeota archaeon]|nr:hypothetical protein [Nanoarchaeota archaeon]
MEQDKVLEQYISQQKERSTQALQRLKIAENVFNNVAMLKSMSDNKLRVYNLSELHPNDHIVKKFKDMDIIVMMESPEVNDKYAPVLNELNELYHKYNARTMNEEEFNFITRTGRVEILNRLFEKNYPSEIPYSLDELRAEVNYGGGNGFYHYGETYK